MTELNMIFLIINIIIGSYIYMPKTDYKDMSDGCHSTVYGVKYDTYHRKVIQECWDACYEDKRVLEHDGYICDIHVNPLEAEIIVKW